MAAALGTGLAGLATLAGAGRAATADFLAAVEEELGILEGFALAVDAGLATDFPLDAATAGRALAPDVAGGAVLAVLVAGAFTAGLLSDPDDARSSGWLDVDALWLRTAPLAA